MRNRIIIAALLTLAGLAFRLLLALHLPNDEPDDATLYKQIAVNILERRSYAIGTDEADPPTLIRVPGYPLFLAGVYKVFGRGNDRAVRVVQAVADTLTCWWIALLALEWAPSNWPTEKRRRSGMMALGLAAFCPFTAIYVTTLLTETCTIFLTAFCVLAASWAMNGKSFLKSAAWWAASGLSGGLATMFRPDSGLFVFAGGATLLLTGLCRARIEGRRILSRTVGFGMILTLGFFVALAPWTIRNARVFGVFQPLAPPSAAMPGQFAPSGYIQWLRTWVDDVRYTAAMEFPLDEGPMYAEQAPSSAFDSPEERRQVAALLERYDNPSAEGDSKTRLRVKMTPDIDAGFAEIARARIARYPLRYYIVLPIRRMFSLWFNTHSMYYPFEGELFPLSDLDRDAHQQYWLPLFAALTLLYTSLGLAGSALMWRDKPSRRWFLLLALLVLPRFVVLSILSHPEPRYTVELFAFVIAAGSLAAVWDGELRSVLF